MNEKEEEEEALTTFDFSGHDVRALCWVIAHLLAREKVTEAVNCSDAAADAARFEEISLKWILTPNGSTRDPKEMTAAVAEAFFKIGFSFQEFLKDVFEPKDVDFFLATAVKALKTVQKANYIKVKTSATVGDSDVRGEKGEC